MTKKNNLPKGRTQFIETSSVFLPKDFLPLRKPKLSWKKRSKEFYKNFEQNALFYDAFWHEDGKHVLLIGPPACNLMPLYKKAKYFVDGKAIKRPIFFTTLSVMVTELKNIPANSKQIEIEFSGLSFILPIQKNYSKELAERRIIFTISKDNPLEWISAWAEYYQKFHDVNAVILVDNGSSKTSLKNIAQALEKTKIQHIFILSWPYVFGVNDDAVLLNPFWTGFLQNAFNTLVLRRFSAHAEGLLNCDIDELATHRSLPTIFEALKQTPKGFLTMQGSWVEANRTNNKMGDHRDFIYQLKNNDERICKAKKWALDPKQNWVKKLNIHLYWHWIENRPANVKTEDKDAFFWHFKGINTNWKEKRTHFNEEKNDNLQIDQELVARIAEWGDNKFE